MYHQEQIVIEPEHDPLPDAPHAANGAADEGVDGRIEGTQHERAQETQALQPPAEDMPRQRLDVDNNVRQLGHDRAALGGTTNVGGSTLIFQRC